MKPQPFEEFEPVIRDGLGADLETIFCEFDREAVAAASLAQVYFARLRSTNEAVAVKVQRPNIRRIIEADFEILLWFVRQAHQRLEDLKPSERHNAGPVLGRAIKNVMTALSHRISRDGFNEELLHEVAAILDEAAQKIERLKKE